MQIAVVIVTWNASKLLDKVLESLNRQTLKPSKVLVIDNGSLDADALLEIVERFPFCELLCLPENLGFAAANNIGFDRCSDFDYVALLNPDAFPEPEWLEQLALAAKAYPACASFASRLLDFSNPDLLDGAGDYLTLIGKPGRRGKGELERGRLTQVVQVFAPCAAAALYSRKKFLECGRFDEDFFCYVEDVDLGFRLRLAGYRCLYVPQSVAHHVGSGTTGGQHSDFSVYHGHRNLVWMFVKDMPGLLFWLLLPLHVMLNLVSIVWFALRGQGGVILRAKRDALLGLPKMWRKRQQIQKSRIASISDIWRVLDKHLIPKIRKS
jgi:GT2 family glycosyltransferase